MLAADSLPDQGEKRIPPGRLPSAGSRRSFIIRLQSSFLQLRGQLDIEITDIVYSVAGFFGERRTAQIYRVKVRNAAVPVCPDQKRAEVNLSHRAGEELSAEMIMFSKEYGVLGETENAREYLKLFMEE